MYLNLLFTFCFFDLHGLCLIIIVAQCFTMYNRLRKPFNVVDVNVFGAFLFSPINQCTEHALQHSLYKATAVFQPFLTLQ